MSDKINLKEIEKKVYLSFHQDGLLDLFLGLAIILFGIGIQIRNLGWNYTSLIPCLKTSLINLFFSPVLK